MRKVEELRQDFYSGSLDELAVLGFVPREVFPGQPGRPRTRVTIRPIGVAKPSERWWTEPGYTTINRTASGQYQMRVTVSREAAAERQKQRQAETQQEEQRAGSSWPFILITPEMLAQATPYQLAYIEGVMTQAFLLDARPSNPRLRLVSSALGSADEGVDSIDVTPATRAPLRLIVTAP